MEAYGDKWQPSADALQRVRAAAEAIYRAESRRVFATLVRLLGDFDLAEEALHDAFRAALEQWPQSGVPDKPGAWLMAAAKRKAIDAFRRNVRAIATDTTDDASVRRMVDQAVARGQHAIAVLLERQGGQFADVAFVELVIEVIDLNIRRPTPEDRAARGGRQ